MATETGHNNVFHTDYKGDRIRLDNFRPPTVNTNQLLRYLIRESKNMIFHNADGRKAALTHLLENHMLAVLTDIYRKRRAGYGNSFAEDWLHGFYPKLAAP